MFEEKPPLTVDGVHSFLFSLGLGETIVVVLLLVIPLYLLFHFKRSKTIISSIQKKIITETKKVVYDDGLLSDRRLRPIYDKVSKRVAKSVAWLENRAKKNGIILRRDRNSKGDGLRSIFAQKHAVGESPFAVGGKRALGDVMPPSLNENESAAFRALYENGVFEGADSTVLRDIVREVSLLSLRAGDKLFGATDPSADGLFILKSGACSVQFSVSGGAPDDVFEVHPGGIIASQVDVIAWVTGCQVPRQLSVVCSEDAEVLKIPSPHGRGDVFKSGLHLNTFARSVRMLLVRINRTTVATALFHLGLAEHILPAYQSLSLPSELLALCERVDSGRGQADREALEDTRVVTPLVRACMTSLYGFTDSKDVDVTVEVSAGGSRPTGPSTPVRRPATGPAAVPPFSLGGDGERKGGSPSAARGAGIGSTNSNSRSNLADSDDALGQPLLSRSLSFDSTFRSGVDICKLADEAPRDPAAQQRSIQTRLFRLRKGQSILDADPVPGLYILVKGDMKVQYVGRNGNKDSAPIIGRPRGGGNSMTVSSGHILGHVALFSGNSEEWYGRKGSKCPPAMTATVSSQDCWLIGVSINSYLRDLVNRPAVIFHVSNRLIDALPPMLRLFDFCTKWKKVDSGENIVVKGQAPTGELQVLLFGRLGVITSEKSGDLKVSPSTEYLWNSPTPTADSTLRSAAPDHPNGGNRSIGSDEPVGEPDFLLGKGALIGEIQLMTGENFKYTVRAMRNCSLAVVPLSLLNFISQLYPSVLAHIARNVSIKQDARLSMSTGGGPQSQSLMMLPVSGSLPFDLVCSTLKHCLSRYVEKVTMFSSADVAAMFGGSPENISESELFMTVGSWLHEVEVDSDLVVFQADWQYTAWNRLISSMCDEIVLVANAMDDPELSEVEERLNVRCRAVPKTLVMLHINPVQDHFPSGTRRWIEQRENVQRHVQVRLNSRHIPFDKYHYRSDFHRLARILSNHAIGLVLGGGGARGLSHLGIIQALEERGIPIDFVGGTSIGSFIGGMYACEQSFVKMEPIVRRYCEKMSSLWFHVQDLTLPITSYFNGVNFMRAIRDIFGERKIEDFWLNYYCITTDLSSSKQLVHTNGTSSRYIRASMSLANYFPPVCDIDARDKSLHFLVDGGYTNCVPVDVMKNRFGAKIIFAVDVSSDWALGADHNYGDSLTGLSVVISRWNPWGKEKLVPSMADIGDKLAYISACEQLERAKVTADLFMAPPVSKLSGTDFSKFDEVRRLGLDYGREHINEWYDSFMSGEQGEEFKWLGKGVKKLVNDGNGSGSNLVLNKSALRVAAEI